ncbi:sensor histidine kinase [Pseudogemmobacter humi]|uniref:sensor histidine kinase n=1 Tax=Pseudogemmobacter humi TaxID=2483812 RepID=UPI0018EF5A86|nr:HAMP domain-containing sensor histidine kinase [Pseudogemmobacter humi]
MDDTFDERARRKNLALLVRLRWIAILGQGLTTGLLHFGFGVVLPLGPMALVIALQALINLAGWLRGRSRRPVAGGELLAMLMADVAALTVMFGLSGGTTNPFISLFLLQIILGALLLRPWAAWLLVATTSLAWIGLSRFHRPLELPHHHGEGQNLFDLHLLGMFICFLLAAALLVRIISQIRDTLRERDTALADLRCQRSEEDHLIRIGLLASGAAHELGSPLATISVILGDWRGLPQIAADPGLARDLAEAESQVERCKRIITGILASSGAARGEGAASTSAGEFFDAAVAEWRAHHPGAVLDYLNRLPPDLVFIADLSLRQALFNLLDNAQKASAAAIRLEIGATDGRIELTVTDQGSGFAPQILAAPARPWNTTSDREGAGLGLFLCSNVARRFGGALKLRNPRGGGAEAAMILPLDPATGGN